MSKYWAGSNSEQYWVEMGMVTGAMVVELYLRVGVYVWMEQSFIAIVGKRCGA